jgi:type II secretory pathway pseudopilin PulG
MKPVEHPLRIRKADGFALIDILFVCAILGILSTIALPRLLLAKQSAGAASAIGSLRTIHSAELTFALTCGGGFYAPDLTTLGRPPANSREPFISPNLSTANTVTRSGYAIQIQGAAFNGAPGSCNGLSGGQAAQGYKAVADPTETGNLRYFGTNDNGAIWENSSTLLGVMPEVGDPAAGRLLR